MTNLEKQLIAALSWILSETDDQETGGINLPEALQNARDLVKENS